MKKIIFLDIDGTIRGFDGTIPDSAVRAIREARARGHQVCICSGRPYCLIDREVLDIGFDGVIAATGAYAAYHGECVGSVYFSHEVADPMCRYLLDHGCMLEMQCYDHSYVPEEIQERYRQFGEDMKELFGENADKILSNPLVVSGAEDVKEIEKIVFFGHELSLEKIQEDWDGKMHMTSMSIPTTERWSGEISPVDVNKTRGIRSILEHSGFSREDVIAAGDSDNDIDMLEYASVGIAMANGTEGAKAAADMVTASVEEDGIEKAFRKLGLI